MGVTVEVKGGDKWKALLSQLSKIGGSVKAGFFGNATNTETGASIPTYAFYNEFGAPNANIPARPFMRNTIATQKEKWFSSVAGQVKGQAEKPEAWKGALFNVGALMASDIQHEIETGSFAPNAPATVAAKKRKGKVDPYHPLIDTGDMIANVRSEVEWK